MPPEIAKTPKSYMASDSVKKVVILTENGNIPGSKFDNSPDEYTVEQLKRWLKCRGLKQSGKRQDYSHVFASA